MRRVLVCLVVPVMIWMASACGGAQAPQAEPATGEGAAAIEGEVCPTGDPGTQPCPEGCKWDEKVQKCMKDRGIIVEFKVPKPPPPPPPPPGS
jgi:hypothetical protein